MTFDIQDTVDLAVAGVTTASAPPAQNGKHLSWTMSNVADCLCVGSISSTFRTDTEISHREAPIARQRELQRWDAGADSSIDMSLEASGETGWDQFAANERMYGVQSSYDESYYTTAIDRSNPQYRQREAEAARIAREIEGSTAANPHVAEERRTNTQDKEDGGLDEEDKYSGVRREGAPASSLPKRGAGSYVPPSQRPITGTPTVPGAPFDPAIISTSKPVPSAPSAPAAAAAEKAVEPSTTRPPTEQPQLQPAATGDAPRDPSAPASSSSQPSIKKPLEGQTAEDHMRKAADAFKEFANLEKLKARAAQEQKKSHIRQEKSVKLNDLKSFSKNFKLNTRVPDDLVPILAKDREKQTEIQNKAEEAAKEAEVKAESKRKAEKAGVTPPKAATASTASAAASRAGTPQAAAQPATEPRLPSGFNNQHSRNKVSNSQQLRGTPGSAGQGQSPRQPQMSQRVQRDFGPGPRGGVQGAQAPALPHELRIPTGPAAKEAREREGGPLSPGGSTGKSSPAFWKRSNSTGVALENRTPSGFVQCRGIRKVSDLALFHYCL